MLTVTIKNGDENSKEYWVNDLGDLKLVQGAITDEFQKVLAQDKSEEKIELERILDASNLDNVNDLIDWIYEAKEMQDDLNRTDFSTVGDMAYALDKMTSALSDIYYISRDFN